MATLKKNIQLSGTGLMSGSESKLTIFPSEQKGIRFFTANQEILASAENVISTQNCVVLGNDTAKIILVEHFMAACSFCNINSLDVCLEGAELPIFDGSSKVWVESFKNAGITSLSEEKTEFNEPIFLENSNSSIALIPADDFKITYIVDFNHSDLQNKWFSFDNAEKSAEIIEARTFGYLKDLEKIQAAGLAKGVSIDNTLGLTDNGYTTYLRSDLEPIKHKILDLIGDLSLTGLNPLNFNAHMIAKEAGHASHVDFAKKIKKYLHED
ncbi:MAG: UDP-3-O-acyl-N-acetylglucosamine deacetylase [Candidatus Gastranaerophilales bacterium]|nr:UDP-3-O-acyl-N-acetylglucosamine deacetylase [Candidatus Gastranaerophilales bacterium]